MSLFEHEVNRRQKTIEIGGTVYTYWPSALNLKPCGDLDAKIKSAGGAQHIGEVVDLVIEQIRLWIPDINLEDLRPFSVIELKALAGELYMNSVTSSPDSLKNVVEAAMEGDRLAAGNTTSITSSSTPNRKARRARKVTVSKPSSE